MKKGTIQNYMKPNSLCEIHYLDEEGFACGYIIAVDDDFLLVNSVTPQGLFDGFALASIDNVVAIVYGSLYTKKIEKLCKMGLFDYAQIKVSDNLLKSILEHSRRNHFLVTIDCSGTKITGKVKDITADDVIIDAVDQYGNNDGIATIDLRFIEYIDCDSEYEQGINALQQA